MDPQLLLSNAQHAIALDPGIADAYARVANAYTNLGQVGAMDWPEAVHRANDALAQGFALAPSDPQLLSQRGFVQAELELNYPAAETSLRASLEADPLQPGAQLNYVGLGELAAARGDPQGALEKFRRALRIDDSSAGIYMLYAGVLLCAGENRESIKIADAGLDLVQSGPVRSYLLVAKARAQYALGDTATANAALDDALASVGPESKFVLAGVLASLCRTEEARQLLVKLEAIEHPPIAEMVAAYAQLDHDRAFEWIHTAIDRHVWALVFSLRVGPIFSELRQDPRWAEVMTHLETEEAKGRAGQNAAGPRT
jgi:adenylate cyclase